MSVDAEGAWTAVTAIAIAVVGSGGLLATWLGYRTKRMELTDRNGGTARIARSRKNTPDAIENLTR